MVSGADTATRRLIVYVVLFPVIVVALLIPLGLARSGSAHLHAEVLAVAWVLMLMPTSVVWAVDVLAGRTLWCALAGFIAVPVAIGAALYPVADPRLLESIYFGAAGAVAAVACRAVAKRLSTSRAAE
jgi:hypothetical protein